MSEMNDIVKLAIDGHRGSVEKYSVSQSQEAIRQALIQANNGKTYLDYRDIRDGKCVGLFTLVETLIDAVMLDGLKEEDYFNSLVEFRNVAEGDSPVFTVENQDLFVVADTADGTQGVRRQRLDGVNKVTIPTTLKTIRVYEEMNRVLSGQIDFNKMIDKVGKSFQQRLLNDVYTAYASITAEQLGGVTYFPVAGAYDEDALLDVISHVEAAAGGKKATIIGTGKALRAAKESINSNAGKDELHNLGYYGKFYGTDVVKMPQRHKVGTGEFIFNDKVLTIVAGEDKPIKVVYEGNPIIIPGNPLDNADLTHEYLYGSKWGVGLVLAASNSGIGKYETA